MRKREPAKKEVHGKRKKFAGEGKRI